MNKLANGACTLEDTVHAPGVSCGSFMLMATDRLFIISYRGLHSVYFRGNEYLRAYRVQEILQERVAKWQAGQTPPNLSELGGDVRCPRRRSGSDSTVRHLATFLSHCSCSCRLQPGTLASISRLWSTAGARHMSGPEVTSDEHHRTPVKQHHNLL